MRVLAGALGLVLILSAGAPAAGEGPGPPAGPGKAAPSLEEEARNLVLLLSEGEYGKVASRFDATMREALPEAKLKATWEKVQAQVGAFQEVEGTRVEKVQVYDVVLVTSRFESSRLDVKLVFNGEREISGLFFAPAAPKEKGAPDEAPATPPYAAPERFREVEMTVGAPGWPLEGTLALPAAPGPHPAVVLVHGSGPHDRDETVGGARPFRDLAWGLASRGVAVLRYEKRTLSHGARLAREIPALTVKDETVDDAVAAVRALAERPGIDASRIFVAGHSLGAMLVPRIAEAGPSIAGFVVMAAPGRPVEELMLEQTRYIAGLDGSISEAEARQMKTIEEAVAAVHALGATGAGTPGAGAILGAPASYWLDLRGYVPQEEAEKVKRPMLVVLGGRDYQVTQTDFDLWKKALASREDVTFRLFPGLNHLFVRGEGPPGPGEYGRPGFVAPEVIEAIAAWILSMARS